ncbi:class I adenylate cyclase [Gallibacterium trehalosifermentans]|uniref:Adenylate cyclase n=1 Tax=Gallibacterium trehalosifermentans TaxID=516935 RepID=A0ABV6GY79_9PAST
MNNLEVAKKKIEQLDSIRLERALAGAPNEFQYVLNLVCVLLHHNIPELPGYVDGSPFGIVNFQYNLYQKNYLSSTLSNTTLFALEHQPQPHLSLCGVYAMGSLGSITQTSCSDLDLWVCASRTLTQPQLDKLQQKFNLICQWAANVGVELNLFLVDQDRFRSGQAVDSLSSDNCGSSQYLLLLDEFYRSAIRLAGRPLLWLHLAIEDETQYDDTVKQLVNEGKLNPNEWVDFGGLGDLSANEYFGATLWNLYKGIDSPYKAVIKILLLECYSWEFPNTHLISHQFKLDLLLDRPVHHQFDPYIAMLDKVTHYLTQMNDFERLDNVRRCFYIKASEDIDKTELTGNWRLTLLMKLTRQWKWDSNTIQELSKRKYWKIKQIRRSYNSLVNLLMCSYRQLMDFARKYNISSGGIIPEDISILTRKLYAAFEELPGKVTLFNPTIATNIAEESLTFIETSGHSAMKKGWYLLNQSPKISSLSKNRHVEYNPNLNKLVCWAYFNGLLTTETKLHIISHSVSLETLQQFVQDLRNTFPTEVSPATNNDLYQPCEICNLAIMVNLVQDPTKDESLIDHHFRLQPKYLFNNLTTKQTKLIGSIDFTYRNLWNEVRTLHFEGPSAIFRALKVLSNKIYRSSIPLESVNVFCYSHRYRNIIRRFTNELIARCINIQTSNLINSNQLNTLYVASEVWNNFFNRDELKITEELLSETELKPISCNDELKYPQAIEYYSNEGFLQFFFEDNPDKTFNIYILDESNQLEAYYHCTGIKSQKIEEINRIYRAATNGENSTPFQVSKNNFNYPQFYQINHIQEKTTVTPYHSSI